MRILFGMVISLIILAIFCVYAPDVVAQKVYQVHDLAQTGKSNQQYKWEKIPTSSP